MVRTDQPGSNDLRRLLEGLLVGQDIASAFDQLWSRSYPRARAALHRLRTAGGHGSELQPTAILHDVYVLQRRRGASPGVVHRVARQILPEGVPIGLSEGGLADLATEFLVTVILLQARVEIAERRRKRSRHRRLEESSRHDRARTGNLHSSESPAEEEAERERRDRLIDDLAWLQRTKPKHCRALILHDALGKTHSVAALELGVGEERSRQLCLEARLLLAHRAQARLFGVTD